MPSPDRRNILSVGLAGAGGRRLTAAMIEAARRRIEGAGGELAVWGILREDVYESNFGDGFYLHLRGLALNHTDANRLAALGRDTAMTQWHIRRYRLGLRDSAPLLVSEWRDEEEFSINDFVELLSEISNNKTTSMLMIGSGASGRQPGAHMLSLP